jgi:hypothetical protein
MGSDNNSPQDSDGQISPAAADNAPAAMENTDPPSHPTHSPDDTSERAFSLDDIIKPFDMPVRRLGELVAEGDLPNYVAAIAGSGLTWTGKLNGPARIWTTDARFIRMQLAAGDENWTYVDHMALSMERLEHATAEEIARKIREVRKPCLVELDVMQLGEPLAEALWRELDGWHEKTVIAIIANPRHVSSRPSSEKLDEIAILQSLIDVSALSGSSSDAITFREQAGRKQWDSSSTGVLEMILSDKQQFEDYFEESLREPDASLSPARAAGQKLVREALLEENGLLQPVAFVLSQMEKIPSKTFSYLCDGFSARRAGVDGVKKPVSSAIVTQLSARRRANQNDSYVQIIGEGRRSGMSETFLGEGFLEADRLFDEVTQLLVHNGIEAGFEFEAGRFFAKARISTQNSTHHGLAQGLQSCLIAVLRGGESNSDRETAFRSVAAMNGFLSAMNEAEFRNETGDHLFQLVGLLSFRQLSDAEDIERAIWISGSALAHIVVSQEYSLNDIMDIEGLSTFACFRGFFETLAEILQDPCQTIALGLKVLEQHENSGRIGCLAAAMHLLQSGSLAYWQLRIHGGTEGVAELDASVLNITLDDLSRLVSQRSYFAPPFSPILNWIQASIPTSFERKLARRYQVSLLDIRRARLVSPMVVALPELLLSGQDDQVFRVALYSWARAHGAPNSAPNIRYISTWLKTTNLGLTLNSMHAGLESLARINRGLCLACLMDLSAEQTSGQLSLKGLGRSPYSAGEQFELREAVADLRMLLHSILEIYDAAKITVSKKHAGMLVASNRHLREKLSAILKSAY